MLHRMMSLENQVANREVFAIDRARARLSHPNRRTQTISPARTCPMTVVLGTMIGALERLLAKLWTD